MEKIFIFAIVFMFIVVIAMFLIVSRMSSGMSKSIQELSLELEETQYPLYHPLGLSSAFLRVILSFLSLFLPGS